MKIATKVILGFISLCMFLPNVKAADSPTPDQTFISVSKTFSGIDAENIPDEFYIEVQDENGTVLATLTSHSEDSFMFSSTTNSNGDTVWTWKVMGLSTGKYQLEEYNFGLDNYIVNFEINGQDENGDISIQQADIEIHLEREPSDQHVDWPISMETFFVGTLTDQAVMVVSVQSLTAAERENVKSALQTQLSPSPFHRPVVFYSLESNAGTMDIDTFTFDVPGGTVTYYRDITTWSGYRHNNYVSSGSGVVFSAKSIWQQSAVGTIDYKNGRNADIAMINSYEHNITEVTVTKVWEDNGDQDGLRPDSVTVKLLANGEDTGDTVILTNEKLSDTFTELVKYDENGDLISYTVEEVIPANSNLAKYYQTPEIAPDGETGNFIITNRHEPIPTKVEGSKTWEDDGPEAVDDTGAIIRPESITIDLFADGAETPIDSAEVTPDENGDWNYSFTGLDMYHDGGIPIIYTVSERSVPNYYTETDESGYNFNNIYIYITKPIEIEKRWIGYVPENDIIVINVIGKVVTSNGDEITLDPIEVPLTIGTQCSLGDVNTSWNCQIDVPKYYYDEDNNDLIEIDYEIIETKLNDDSFDNNNQINIYDEEIPNQIAGVWTSQVQGFTIQNTWMPNPKTGFSLTKVAFGTEGTVTKLDGAVFALYKYIGSDFASVDYDNLDSADWFKIGSDVISDANGEIAFNDLYAGYYRLVEVTPPAGYILPSGFWLVTIDDDLNVSYDAINRAPGIDVNNYIYNEHVPIMPETGSRGIIDFSLIGLLFMTIGSFFFIVTQKDKI